MCTFSSTEQWWEDANLLEDETNGGAGRVEERGEGYRGVGHPCEGWRVGSLSPLGSSGHNPLGSLDGRNRAIVIAEALARVIGAYRCDLNH